MEKQAGLITRISGMLDLIGKMSDDLSDEETEGLLSLLPPEAAESLSAFFDPHVRREGMIFLKMLGYWLNKAKEAKKVGHKVVLVPFNFPPEIINVFDKATPLTCELLSTLASAALEGKGEAYWDVTQALGLPDHICSSNSIELGSILSGADLAPDAIVSAAPGACDINSKIHEFVSHYMEIPQFILEKPVDDDKIGRELYAKYFRILISQLEDFIGEKVTEEKLRRVIEKANRCSELYWELWELHKARPCPVPNLYSMFIAGVRFCMWGTDSGIATLEAMVDAVKERLKERAYPAKEEKARCLWAYTSYYFNLKELYSWMEKRGYTHLADVLDLCMPCPIDTSSTDTMIHGLIETAWNYPMTRQMGSASMSKMWIEDMIHVAKELKADCLIYCGHDSCKQTWSVVSILREELMKREGIPVLILHGDSWRSTTTPITVLQDDIEEFINNVVIPKKGGKRKVRKVRKAKKKN